MIMKPTTRSQEDFLEALLMLEEAGEPLETTRMAKKLGISKPAIHQMGHELINKGYITRIDYGDMSLTEEGRKIAKSILHRHQVLKDFLLSIGVDEQTAEDDGCEMEHIISEATFEAIEKKLNSK
ncbi:MAG: metal-dependent transcriptional regulator [Erysipelotrichaceae bacterium]|jgi:Mn-dependent DtxR family transcriptional regulator|nr:metal-dependent transcriptional regulator [Erysipelotrichaceae bacterium]